MKILRFLEQHSERNFIFSTFMEKTLILAQVAQERLDDGHWYDESDAQCIRSLLEKLFDPNKRKWEHEPAITYLDQIHKWMANRRKYEYEDWRELTIEKPQLTHYEGIIR